MRSAMRPRLGADVIPVSTTESPSGSSPSSGMSIDTDDPANVREVSGVGSGARFSPASFATTVNVTFALAVCSKSSPMVYTAVWTPGSSGAWNRTLVVVDEREPLQATRVGEFGHHVDRGRRQDGSRSRAPGRTRCHPPGR